MVDYGIQRMNMVESQVRTADVTDRRIVRAMLAIPREAFVPGVAKATAYIDDNLRISDAGTPRFLLAPRTLAKLVQLLELSEQDVVLDVGCATGYSTAVLSPLAARVVGLEQDPVLADSARKTLAGLGANNADIRTGPLTGGVADAAPFDAVLISGSITAVPDALFDQLKDGGRLAAIQSVQGLGKATLWRRNGSVFDGRPMFDATAPILPGFEAKQVFVL
jgi:protein-L-isoaspartate(D-aspartate) O-methyltransferase